MTHTPTDELEMVTITAITFDRLVAERDELVAALRDLLADSDPDSPLAGSQIVARNVLAKVNK